MGILLLSSEADASSAVATAAGPLIRWLPEAPVQQLQQWRTDVLKAHDGTEQRIAILPTPRDRFELAWVLDDAQMREVRGNLLTAPDQTFLVPLAHESEALTAPLTGTTLYFDQTFCDWCQVGRSVLVLPYDDTGDVSHQATITAVDPAGSVTISPTASPLTFAAGAARVYPLAPLYVTDGARMARYPVRAGDWSLSGATDRLLPVLGTGASLTEYDGVIVMDEPPLNTSQVEEGTEAGVQLLDYGGAITSAWGRDQADFVRGVRLLLATRGERQWGKAFLAALYGSQVAFLLPTWRPDLPVVNGASLGGDTIDVESSDFIGSPAHTRVQLLYADGSVAYHTIVTATDNLDGTHSIELTPVFAAAVDEDTVVSWLELCRLASDPAWTHFGARSVLNLSALVVQQ